MIDPKKIEQLARQIHESIPKGIREFSSDIEKKMRQILQDQIMRLELVNREEFDVQIELLRRTKETLVHLENRLNALEKYHMLDQMNASQEGRKITDEQGERKS